MVFGMGRTLGQSASYDEKFQAKVSKAFIVQARFEKLESLAAGYLKEWTVKENKWDKAAIAFTAYGAVVNTAGAKQVVEKAAQNFVNIGERQRTAGVKLMAEYYGKIHTFNKTESKEMTDSIKHLEALRKDVDKTAKKSKEDVGKVAHEEAVKAHDAYIESASGHIDAFFEKAEFFVEACKSWVTIEKELDKSMVRELEGIC